MTLPAEFLFAFDQKSRIVASVGLMAGGTALLQRLVAMLTFKLTAVMTRVAQFRRRTLENPRFFTGMGVMTSCTAAVSRRLMRVGCVQAQGILLMAPRAQGGTRIFQAQHTDQSVRLRTHWAAGDASKFSAARLLNVAPAIVQNSTYLRMLCEGDAEQRRRQATLHWLAESDQATAHGDVGVAHENLVRAGWDLGAEPISTYAEILERIAETALQANREAQAELADTHRACLRSRFGV